MPLPRILAGPIIRRTDCSAVWIWLCTSEEIALDAMIFSVTEAHQLGEQLGQTETRRHIQLGEQLHIYLLKVVPQFSQFDHTTVLAYRLYESGGTRDNLTGYDESQFAVGPYSFPTFVIQNPRSNALRVLYCSCRKLHGDGDDASSGMLRQFTAQLLSRAERPTLRTTSLFLTGDQIYADDVSHIIFPSLRRLATQLRPETLPNLPEPLNLDSNAARQQYMTRYAGFTSAEAQNHLITLGEYAAMYLYSWNEQIWEETSEWFQPIPSGMDDFHEHGNIIQERNNLINAKLGSAAMRKLLANIPSYMMFDDHDITDDWNINPSWQRHVNSKTLGKRIISNALVAYWAFQGWGNDPDAFDDDFIARVEEYLALGAAEATSTRNQFYAYLNHNREQQLWSFRAPTKPAAVFIDFRTQRSAAQDTDINDTIVNLRNTLAALLVSELEVSPNFETIARLRQTRLDATLGANRLNGMPPRFFSERLRSRARRLVQSLHGQPMILITGTPLIGASVLDVGQDIAVFLWGSFTWDFENWRGDPENLLDLYALIRYSEASVCAVLSGDVHYASAFIGSVEWPSGASPRRINIGQFTSSAAKNSSFPPGQILRMAQELIDSGQNLSCRWLYDGRSSREGTGVTTARVLFGTSAYMQAFAPTWSMSAAPSSAGLPEWVYCDETWNMQALTSGGIVTENNFGVLVASNNARQVISVQIYNALGATLGDTMRLSTSS